MIACSGFVNDSIRTKAWQSGFDLVIELPLTQVKIQDEILKRLSIKKVFSESVEGDQISGLGLEEDKLIFNALQKEQFMEHQFEKKLMQSSFDSDVKMLKESGEDQISIESPLLSSSQDYMFRLKEAEKVL